MVIIEMDVEVLNVKCARAIEASMIGFKQGNLPQALVEYTKAETFRELADESYCKFYEKADEIACKLKIDINTWQETIENFITKGAAE